MTNNETDASSNPGLRKVIIIAIGGITLIFLAGVMAGFTRVSLEEGALGMKEIGIMIVIVALMASTVLAGWKLWPRGAAEPISQSTRKSRNWMYAATGFGALLGLGFALAEGPGENLLFSNDPIGPFVASLAIIAWLVIVPAITWAWWRNVDEHEASAYRDSSLIGAHAYLFLAPSWWLASRAGWLPAQDPMIMFAIVCVVMLLAWAYRKYQ